VNIVGAVQADRRDSRERRDKDQTGEHPE
jgi:hypothetical protein